MILKIISAALILFTTFIAFKHSLPMLTNDAQLITMMTSFQLSKLFLKVVAVLTLAGGLMILFPLTFFWGNYLNAAIILVLMLHFLGVGEYKHLLMEIPFIAMPFVIQYLKHPLAGR